jgi:TPR repeat protein
MPTSPAETISRCLRINIVTGVIALALGAGCDKWSGAAAPARDCGDGPSCVALARSLLGDNYPTRPAEVRARAAVIYQKGCDLGSAQACQFLGSLLEDSDLVPRDLPRAARLFERGCTLKDAIACNSLSHLYHDARRSVRSGPRRALLQARVRPRPDSAGPGVAGAALSVTTRGRFVLRLHPMLSRLCPCSSF